MPPTSRTGGTFRRIAAVVLVVAIAGGAYAFNELGSFLAAEDPLQKSDAIFVLAGSRMERPLEAADLYFAGYAPQLVLSRQRRDGGELDLVRRGLPIPEDVQVARDVFVKLGIPEEAILIPTAIHDSTAAEAQTLRQLAGRRGWRSVIVVSSAYHLRRAGFAFRRELEGTDVNIVMRRTQYDDAKPDRWWQMRGDIREVVPETQKLIAYLAGLGA